MTSCSNFRSFDEGLRVNGSITRPKVMMFKNVHKVSLQNTEKAWSVRFLMPS